MAALFLLLVLVKLSLITGLVILSVVALGYAFRSMLVVQKAKKLIPLAAAAILLGGAGLFIHSEWKEVVYVRDSPVNEIRLLSASGRTYMPVPAIRHTENGYYEECNIQYDELFKEWPKRSRLPLSSADGKGGNLNHTLIRYLTSKGLTKDSAGIAALSQDEIAQIEKGVTSVQERSVSALQLRLRDFFREYQDYRVNSDPSGNSLLMRFEFWKTAFYIIKRSPWKGVGTGDARLAFRQAYLRMDSTLDHEWRLRSHNQFLAIAVCFGIPGLLIFLWSLIRPVRILAGQLHPLYAVFLSIAVLSFLTEDTLETQPGVTFFAYFNSLLLWYSQNRKDEADQNL